MTQIKVDSTRHIYATNELSKTHMPKVAEKADKPSIKDVDLNQYDQQLLVESREVLQQAPEVDMERVAQIKAQIQSGEIKFDMGELAKVLANLN
ncbi:MAG: flagellar biosynthesis anti-sigma factor FlgM [Vibrio sp.]